MDPFTVAAVGMTAFSAYNSLTGGASAARRRKAFIDEKAREMRLEHDRTTSLATAAGAASGIEFESQSLQTALSTMTNEFRRQEDVFKKSGYSEARAMEDAGMWNAFGDIAGGLFAIGAKSKSGRG